MKRPRISLGLFSILEQKEAKMKYNAEYGLYVTTGGLIFSYNSEEDKLELCVIKDNGCGYKKVTGLKRGYVHRIVWETFNGKIPQGYEIDHQDTNKENNALDNLNICTHKENLNNPITREHKSKSLLGNTNTRGKCKSEFGNKFKEHFGITQYQNMSLYKREYAWFMRHRKCRWE